MAASVAAIDLAAPAWGADGQKLSVTIYNSDIALVQDVRSLDIPAGRSRQEFRDVSARIRPETVSLSAAGIGIVEQNFDFDLLTPDKLMEKAVGKQVQIVRINPGNGAQVTETATVLSVNEGVVLRVGDKIEVLRADDIPTRVIFDRIPDNLRARPTLSVTVDSQRAGVRPATLSYLTNGLSWKADYVALFEEKAGTLDIQGWVTLTNQSGVEYPMADVQLVAGDVNLIGSEQEYWNRETRARAARRVAAAQPQQMAQGPQSLADYYLYTLSQKTTVAQNQTKQVSLIDLKGATGRKTYLYRSYGFESEEQPVSADVVIQFANTDATGLGHQLPAGIVRVYVRDQAGEPKFVGENRIDHTPRGMDVSVKIGDAFDVTVQPTVVSSEKISRTRTRYEMAYVVRNARGAPATVVVRQGGLGREGKVAKESLPSKRIDAYNLGWEVPVPASGETRLTATIETGW
ncbi:MAG TPA: DUF4139 domain-containing protein [Phenylobacterium sp.]